MRLLIVLGLVVCVAACVPIFAEPTGGWQLGDWVIKDKIGEVEDGSLDLCNVFCRSQAGEVIFKITTRAPIEEWANVQVMLADGRGASVFVSRADKSAASHYTVYRGVAEVSVRVPPSWSGLRSLTVRLVDTRTGQTADEGTVDMNTRRPLDDETGNCAFIHHGNQGLTYTDVFRGTGDTTGFDEVLELHETRQAPGNFHMSGTLITAAEWYDPTFNQWLRDGISEGWVAMLGSAYAQHIMPFVQDNMNNWAVGIEQDMISTVYGYNARVAWIPERVWVSQGHYPDGGIVDPWLGDNWTTHGVDAVILDDWPHCSGASDRKIHWVQNGSGIILRLIPIDGDFTGNCHYNPGAAIAQISGTGAGGIVVYGTDWEAAGELADFSCPSCLENYSAVVNWAADNYPGVGVWKLDAALDNSAFNGVSHEVVCGTYGLIGGTDGYGGSNNSWYTGWASTASHSDFHSPAWDYGSTWWNAYTNLMGAPANDCSESGWYVMMTNLHETGWHDYMGGPISGWEHRYSSHIKNANVYAEAAHWAAGEYTSPVVNAYSSDVDDDGVDELVIHNDRVMAVFESIGGRAQWIFARGTGYGYSVVGSCNTYWAETDGDYDEPGSNNHQAAFAEVSPTYRNDLYTMVVDSVGDSVATIRLTHNEISKTISLTLGQTYLRAAYDVGPGTCYLRHGFSPDLVDLIWNADMQRIWPPDASYMGFRNPNTGATGACVLANGGAAHQLEFSGTLLRGDELRGSALFAFLLYAGETSAPDAQGRIAELEALKTLNLDHFKPRLDAQAVFISGNTVQVSFNESVDLTTSQNPTNWSLQGFTGSYTVTAAVRQADWRRVRLTVYPNLAGGDNGTIVATNVEDLNDNVVDPDYDTATLAVPSGLTPHTIVIDGVNEFDRPSECLFGGTDSLFITWDSSALYVGYLPKDLATADFFIHIDVNQQNGQGAQTGSWGRERFADPYRIEYQIAIEGGVGGPQCNYWTGSAWQYPGAGTPPVTSYNGWSGNTFTEVRIPWATIGNPTGIALAVSLTGEDNQNTTRVFPTSNPTGTLVTLTQMYRFYQPYILGPMPLYGVQPKWVLTGDLLPPDDVVILMEGSAMRLQWSSVTGAATYVIYRATSMSGPFTQIDETSSTQYDDDDVLAGSAYFYEVRAKSGI